MRTSSLSIARFNNLFPKAYIYILAFITLCLILLSSTSFPSLTTTLTPPPKHTTQPPWLLITSSASSDFQRRLLVRWTWVSLFHRSDIFDHIFAVSSTDPVLLSLIKKENDTFGDILLLDDIEDTNWTANHIKPFEFFKRVTNKAWKGRTYKFVSKVDQDSFIDPVRIWNKYLKGRTRDTEIEEDRLMLSMSHEAFCECPAPQGSFYTLSWDLAKLITRLYDGMEDRKDIEQEDCMVGKFPTQAGEQYEFVSMDEEESFDVIGEKGGAIAKDWSKDHAERGPLEKMEKVVFLHQMKEEWKWLAVKELFNKDGWARNGSSGETV